MRLQEIQKPKPRTDSQQSFRIWERNGFFGMQQMERENFFFFLLRPKLSEI